MTIAASPDALSLEETMIRQARESFQRLPTLEIIIDRLLLALVPDLKSYCTVAPEIELSSLEYMPYEDAMESIQSPSLIAIANAESWGSQIACTSQQWKPRGLTAIEQKLGRRLAELSLKGLAHCLQDVSPVQFDIQSLESNPRSVMLAAPRTATVLVRLHMQFEDRSGHMALVLPYHHGHHHRRAAAGDDPAA